MSEIKRLAILGGSFNPVHIGHIRLGIEIFERLRPDRLDFIPNSLPPHKVKNEVLPFDFRLQLLKTAIKNYPAFTANSLENDRPGFSYTVDTLKSYIKSYPRTEIYFIIGATELPTLPLWKQGLTIPGLANLAVAPRSGFGAGEFDILIKDLWPDAREQQDELKTYVLPQGKKIVFIDAPILNVSATLIRDKWLRGESLSLLVPPEVEALLQEKSDLLGKYWKTRKLPP